MIAVNSPAANSTDTDRSACTCDSPRPYVLTNRSADAAAVPADAVPGAIEVDMVCPSPLLCHVVAAALLRSDPRGTTLQDPPRPAPYGLTLILPAPPPTRTCHPSRMPCATDVTGPDFDLITLRGVLSNRDSPRAC